MFGCCRQMGDMFDIVLVLFSLHVVTVFVTLSNVITVLRFTVIDLTVHVVTVLVAMSLSALLSLHLVVKVLIITVPMVTVLMVTKLVVTVLVVTALVATVLFVTVPVITVPVVNILVVTGHCACCLCLFKKCFPNCYDFSRSYSTFFLVFLLDLSPSCTVIQFFLWCLSFLVLVFISFPSVIRTFFSILYYRYVIEQNILDNF